MRRSTIWFVLALGWGLDSGVALFRRNWQQSGLTAFFACCFVALGLYFRKRERKPQIPRLRA
jgi:hypothetical protein